MLEVISGVTRAIENVAKYFKPSSKESKKDQGRRGGFESVSFGVSYGGGQIVEYFISGITFELVFKLLYQAPMQRVLSQHNEALIDEFCKDTAVVSYVKYAMSESSI